MHSKTQREHDYMWSKVLRGKAPHHGKVITIKPAVIISTRKLPPFYNKGNYSSEWNSGLRQVIRTRDGFACKVCAIENPPYLNVHHIDYNKANLKESNLISLCPSCHYKTNRHRQAWYRHLYQLIRTLNPEYA